MVSFYSLIIFFFILVLLYTAVTLVLSFSGWLLKLRASRGNQPADEVRLAIDRRTDRLKSLAFNATAILVLFVITPFVLLYFMVWR